MRLYLSILLNFLLLAAIAFIIGRLGGWRFAWHRFSNDEAGLYAHRKQLFENLPARPGAVIFLGDSQVQGCEWQELCGGLTTAPLLNRGIAGDHVEGVAARLGEVLRHKPRQLFIQVGINDLLFGKKPAVIAAEYRAVLERIRRESPDTQLFVHSVLPVNNQVKRVGIDNAAIDALNTELRVVTAGLKLAYIDLYAVLGDPEGALADSFTEDGIHLNGRGYQRWRNELEPYLVR
jgi:lysophospholipase L1-like esterase